MASIEFSSSRATVPRCLDPYVGIARPKFLPFPMAVIALGSTTAANTGSFDMLRTAVAEIGHSRLHIAVNALSEYRDSHREIDEMGDFTTPRTW